MLAVVRDVVDPVNDEKLAAFVVGNHIASHPAVQERKRAAMEEGRPLPQEEQTSKWVQAVASSATAYTWCLCQMSSC